MTATRLVAVAGISICLVASVWAATPAAGDLSRGKHIFETVCHQCHYAKPYTGRIGDENLPKFLANPRAYKPTTAMTFRGLRNARDIADIIAFITEGH